MVKIIVELREKGENIQYEIDSAYLEKDRVNTKSKAADAIMHGIITGKVKEGNYEDEIDNYKMNVETIETIRKCGVKLEDNDCDFEMYFNVDSIMASPPKVLGPSMHG